MSEPVQIKLSEHAREFIDSCLLKYPEDQKQSAILSALAEVQHENNGFLTEPLMDLVAEYLDMPKIGVYK